MKDKIFIHNDISQRKWTLNECYLVLAKFGCSRRTESCGRQL